MWFKHHLLSVLQIAVIHSVQLLACVHSATVQAFFISFRSDEIVTSQIEHCHDLMWNYLTISYSRLRSWFMNDAWTVSGWLTAPETCLWAYQYQRLWCIYINYPHAFDGIQNIMLHDTSILDRAGNIEVLEETKIPAWAFTCLVVCG
jgi:hypothetical protein